MNTIIKRALIVATLCAGVSAVPAFAKDHGRHEWREHRQIAAERHERHHEFARERREHERARWAHERREHERARWQREHQRPAGWDHGRKTGWGDHHVPPGQRNVHPQGSSAPAAPVTQAAAPTNNSGHTPWVRSVLKK